MVRLMCRLFVSCSSRFMMMNLVVLMLNVLMVSVYRVSGEWLVGWGWLGGVVMEVCMVMF